MAAWWTEVKHDIRDLDSDFSVYFHSETDETNAWFEVHYDGDNMWDYYDDIQAIADNYGLSVEDFSSDYCELINW